MRILYIYRNINAGPSIRRVFEPVAEFLGKNNIIENYYLPYKGISIFNLFRNILSLKKYLRNKQYDVIHITGDVYYLMWVLYKYNTIVTIHDLLFYTRINNRFKKLLMNILELYPIRFAKAITFISYASMKEAQNIIDNIQKKAFVVYNPVNETFSPSPKKFNFDYPTILHLGTKTNKNLPRVLKALNGIKCKLHIVGDIDSSLVQMLRDLEIDAKLECNLTDEQILQAYKECDIVCFPSLYEGFGMPIIESQMIGRPVVTSDISPMKDIACDAAILVNPLSVESIRNGILEVKRKYNYIIPLGFENAKRFTVEKISFQYLDIYNKVLI